MAGSGMNTINSNKSSLSSEGPFNPLANVAMLKHNEDSQKITMITLGSNANTKIKDGTIKELKANNRALYNEFIRSEDRENFLRDNVTNINLQDFKKEDLQNLAEELCKEFVIEAFNPKVPSNKEAIKNFSKINDKEQFVSDVSEKLNLNFNQQEIKDVVKQIESNIKAASLTRK